MNTDQKKFWKDKPKLKLKEKPNYFAIKSYSYIKNRKYKALLDLGCGLSRDPIYFAKKGYNVTALDVSKNRLQSLKEEALRLDLNNINFKIQDISRLSLQDKSFDIIYAHLSLHYFNHETTVRIFKKIHKLLKKNGMFFVKCKSIDDPEYKKSKKISNGLLIYRGKIKHFFTKEYLASLLKDFRIMQIRRTGSVYIGHREKSKYIEAIAKKQY